MAKPNGDEVTAIVPVSEYKIVARREKLLEVIEANMGPGGLTERDLTRISIPAGGSTRWVKQTLAGEELVEKIVAIPIMWRDYRLFWRAEYGKGELRPPNCKTIDAIATRGVGDPGGDCLMCPMYQFDEATGKKPCKAYRALFACGPDDFFPFVFVLPITSQIVCNNFFGLMMKEGIPFYGASLRFTLTKETNKGSIDYSRVKMEIDRELSDEDADKMKAVSESLKAHIGGFEVIETVQNTEQ